MRLVNSYYVNIAIEGIAAIFMLILFSVLRRQKNQLASRKHLRDLVLVETLLLVCQITEWAVNINENIRYGEHTALFILDKLAAASDVVLFYLIYLFAYKYIENHIEYLRELNGDNRKYPDKIGIFLAVWIAVPVLLYLTSVKTGFLFSVSDSGKIHIHYEVYWIIYLLCLLPSLLCYIMLIKNRKIISFRNMLLFLAYLFVPGALLIVDIFLYTSLSYVSVAVIIFLLYVRIDIEKSKLLYESEISNVKKESELRDIKIALVVSQIQPHFIYNTLNAIHYLVGKNPEYAQKIIKDFSKYLRMNMDSVNSTGTVEFTKELEHIRTYLEIEQLRFDDLEVKYDIAVTNFFIPPLSVQPLVENAVKHGICQNDDGGTVLIASAETDDSFVITVEDSGTGFDVNEKKNDGRSHIGIENTKKRLQEICNATVKIESVIGTGTKVTITLPKTGDMQDENISLR